MPANLYDGWCATKATNLENGARLHLLNEIVGARPKVHSKISHTVLSHYEDPKYLADCIKRHGFKKAAAVLQKMLPTTKTARSGHIGEILATEAVPAILPGFEIPIKRLRWLDGRESALRGEDIIGIARERRRVRFLKGESKSYINLGPGVVTAARKALMAKKGRPSQHAMTFVMHRLFETQEEDLALIFEERLLARSIPEEDLVHFLFGLSGNDASASLQEDLNAYAGDIEQHAVNVRITDHKAFVASLYEK